MRGDGFLSPWDSIPFFDNVQETQWAVFPADNKIVQANPRRVGLIFSSNGTQPVRISTKSSVSTSSGLLLAANGIPWSLTHAEYGVAVQVEWYGVPSGAGGTLCVLEVLLSKWPGEESDARSITPADVRRAAVAYGRALALMKGGQRAS